MHHSFMFCIGTFLPFKNKLKINAKTANPVAIQNASLMPSIYASDLRILR